MDPFEISKQLTWANDGSRTLHFAFAVANDNDNGLLCLHRHHKGKAILHDLLRANQDVDLRSRRFGTVSTDPTTSTVNFSSNRRFGNRELRALKALLKQTKLRAYDIAFADPTRDDDDEQE